MASLQCRYCEKNFRDAEKAREHLNNEHRVPISGESIKWKK